ncbi:LOW QUALITY PROTEIN: E3 ubiquitin-protein ligase rnf213-alpha-like [Lethenteron reissneri]|uniref:LOW QUALITY PROTEIN: E3 ubiquitin-protein ligase rnf213-alpha-like n=1 Tax=Lethenteron reissneri TaxID=7753 RepID=UPI002AB6E9ED|nr:LOW QUALITY PROTEIN: E3 ubiquitin-protein ligase rnf213-alpha-like [Lethenteron reissneri]
MLMQTALKTFQQLVTKILDGTVSLGILQLVLDSALSFHAIYSVLQGHGPDRREMELMLTRRQEEVTAVHEEVRNVEAMVRMCHAIGDIVQVDVSALESQCGRSLAPCPLHDLAWWMGSGSGGAIVVTYFGISSELRQFARGCLLLSRSVAFLELWKEAALAARHQVLHRAGVAAACWCGACRLAYEAAAAAAAGSPALTSLDCVRLLVWQPSLRAAWSLIAELRNGAARLHDIRRLFAALEGRPADVGPELAALAAGLGGSPDAGWVAQRAWQIARYQEMGPEVGVARVVLAVRDVLELTGDFDALLELTHEEFHSKKIKHITSKLVSAMDTLMEVTPARLECLEQLSQSKQLLVWIKGTLKNLTELKVFVDLASITAGESDLEVDRVAFFHDAVQGYSPLLYDLPAGAGFPELADAARSVWRSLDSDANLTLKLRCSVQHLPWLQAVWHGSVEMSTLSMATVINHTGVYHVGAIVGSGDKPSLETVLLLTLPDPSAAGGSGEGDGALHTFRIHELRELHSKLMLTCGTREWSEEVETFTEVLESVLRLADTHLALSASANPLFRRWTVRVASAGVATSRITVEFGLPGAGALVVDGGAPRQLALLCAGSERCLDEWRAHVKALRRHYPQLDLYTAQQVACLCSEVGELARGGVGPGAASALAMLSLVKEDCTARDVQQAVSDEAAAPVAMTTDDERYDGGDDGNNVPGLNNPGADVTESPRLDRQLLRLWRSFMATGSAVPPDGDPGVEAVARVLARLSAAARASPGRRAVCRRLPEGLARGQPNLVVCADEEEEFTSALSLYLCDEDKPLPAPDEVLVCSLDTTVEELELFMRRALSGDAGDGGDGNVKIHSLLCADRLSYEASVRMEELVLVERRPAGRYQLVVFCHAREEHCYAASCLGEFRASAAPRVPAEQLRWCLWRRLQVEAERGGWAAPVAANAFAERLRARVVWSTRPGVGKSLHVQRMHDVLRSTFGGRSRLHTVRLMGQAVDEAAVVASLLKLQEPPGQERPHLVHVDVTAAVCSGLSAFLFRLLALRCLSGAGGAMWRCSASHLYVVEITQGEGGEGEEVVGGASSDSCRAPRGLRLLDLFPGVRCHSPRECLDRQASTQAQRQAQGQAQGQLMDHLLFVSEWYQRPFQYLERLRLQQDLDSFSYRPSPAEGTPALWLRTVLAYCGVADPSWAELRNFLRFLDVQLLDCERSAFCDREHVGDVLPGFRRFVVEFVVLMARDFATPSLDVSDESSQALRRRAGEGDLAPFQIRKAWESRPHPYVFFNADRHSLTFLGFHLQLNLRRGVDAVDPRTRDVLKPDAIGIQLYMSLRAQRVDFNVNFDTLPRNAKVEMLCTVLGIAQPSDPDTTYELTMDNVLKMLAIHMRLRCGIPVVVMGETGCGKTRLVKYLCSLQRGHLQADNMKLLKVHGGTTVADVHAKIREVEVAARLNKARFGLDTVLFFDEANTTEAIHAIKEALCDGTVDGEPFDANCGLKIVAACNPYRMHSEAKIRQLESSGLGYRMAASQTAERLGGIPLRHLVYRVHPLPPSLMPLVWDFGRLSDDVEGRYIGQIVERALAPHGVPVGGAALVARALAASQRHVRSRRDECGFASLRDAERCIVVFLWLYARREALFASRMVPLGGRAALDAVTRALVVAVGVCYHCSMRDREGYRRSVCEELPAPFDNPDRVLAEITACQELFLGNLELGETIARNAALRENVFMMVVCAELRIPLFLVGKPGSSKSLAKAVVSHAMQGPFAPMEFYRCFKQIHAVSFQCSPHSTSEGIVGTFRQCARFQEGKNLEEFVSVVVLDEVGLAEDSPKMPLKALHPLLEDGSVDDNPKPHQKVGFVGISNWALDPAKMNRGISVARGSPDKAELVATARGICSSDHLILSVLEGLFSTLAGGYLRVCERQKRGFFGLRDFYSLVKMLFGTCQRSGSAPTVPELQRAILRNFGGSLDVEPLAIFGVADQGCHDPLSLVRENIASGADETECRYLLLLTQNYSALSILQQDASLGLADGAEIIFGSSFPRDQEYTQVCRTINRIKVCMEAGRMVVLLNLQGLYESLYDALNQYYVHLGGQRYVDLGLGTHRVKCRVQRRFRLVVIEESRVVHRHFPVPLVNRLEKHFLDMGVVLREGQRRLAEVLGRWLRSFTEMVGDETSGGRWPDDEEGEDGRAGGGGGPRIAAVIVGYHSDACAAVALQVASRMAPDVPEGLDGPLAEAQETLLRCAAPDAVVRLRHSRLSAAAAEIWQKYFVHQRHGSLQEFVRQQLELASDGLLVEVTTHARLLTATDAAVIAKAVSNPPAGFVLLALQQIDTEHAFSKRVREVFSAPGDRRCLLLIQSDFEDISHGPNLVACAKYCAMNERSRAGAARSRVHVIFITKLPRVATTTSSEYVGFHGGQWISVHIDDLRSSEDLLGDVVSMWGLSLSEVFARCCGVTRSESTEGEEPEEERRGYLRSVPSRTPWLTSTGSARRLVASCVQAACSSLRDPPALSARSTRRVHLLLQLLETHGEFSEELMRQILRLMKRRDEDTDAPCDWMLKEACKVNAIQEGGSFRHTLWRRLQAVVTPLLAQLLSVVDRDSNLDLLLGPTCQQDLRSLWMQVFRDTRVLHVPYSNDISWGRREEIRMPSSYGEQQQRALQGQGCALPFSWIFRQQLEQLWWEAKHLSRSLGGESSERRLPGLFTSSCLGSLCSQLGPSCRSKLSLLYLHDLVATSFPIRTPNELQLLCLALAEASAEQWGQDEMSPVGVHAALETVRPRLQNLLRLAAAFPDVAERIAEQSERQGGATEMTLDLQTAVSCLESLEPPALPEEAEEAEAAAAWGRWLSRVGAVRSVMERMASADYGEQCGPGGRSLVTLTRTLLQRVLCVSLLVEHVVWGCRQDAALLRLTSPLPAALWQALALNSDMKQLAPLETTMALLSSCVRNTKTLPHRARKKARESLCSVVTVFFTELVSQLSFRGRAAPSHPVLHRLLDMLLLEQSTEGTQCGEGSPWADCIRPSPALRSALLKLLLRYAGTRVPRPKTPPGDSNGQDSTQDLQTSVAQAKFETGTALASECEGLVRRAEELCRRPGGAWPQLYLLRSLASRFGLDRLPSLCHRFPWLLPPELHGREASGAHNAERQVLLVLAVYRELTSTSQERVANQLREFSTHCHLLRASPPLHDLCRSLVRDSFAGPLAAADPRRSLLETLAHLDAVLRARPASRLLAPLRRLARDPRALQDSLLATMPDDIRDQARSMELGSGSFEFTRWYECKNGHPCLCPHRAGHPDGNQCGAPTQTARCIECGVAVGGVSHIPVAGFTAVSPGKEHTRRGHVLGDPSRRDSGLTSDRGVPALAFGVLRALTHAAMLLGYISDPKGTAGLIDPRVGDAAAFLLRHLEQDLQQLSSALGRSTDDALLLVHLATARLLHLEPGGSDENDGRLTSRQQRADWESDFTRQALSPLLKDLEQNLEELRRLVSDDRRGPLMRMLYGDPTQQQQQQDELWRYHPRVSAQHLSSLLEQQELQQELPVLTLFLAQVSDRFRPSLGCGAGRRFRLRFPPRTQNREPERQLRLVRHLPALVSLARELVSRFCFADRESNLGSIHRYLSAVCPEMLHLCVSVSPYVSPCGPTIAGAVQHDLYAKAELFVSVWNQLRTAIRDENELGVPASLLEEDLSVESDALVLLPRRTGPGLVASALLSRLVALHNRVVAASESADAHDVPLPVPVSAVCEPYVVSYDADQELLPLLASARGYAAAEPVAAADNLHLHGLQRQIVHRFIRGRPRIDVTDLPTLVSPQDRDFSVLFSDLRLKLPQVALPSALQDRVRGQLRSFLYTTEAHSAVQIVAGFLASGGGDGESGLRPFLCDTIRMNQLSPHVLQVLEACRLKHVTSLWHVLSAMRSEHFLLNNQEPFPRLPSESYREPLSAAQEERLSVLLGGRSGGALAALALALHGFILLALCRRGAHDAHWGLAETLAAEGIEWLVEQDLDAEVTVGQSAAVWRAVVTHRERRRTSLNNDHSA